MALWKKKARKKKSPLSTANPSITAPQKQRKLFSPEVKLLAVKALEAGLTPAEVSEIVGAGNSSVTAWARAFRDGGMEALVRKSTSATTRRICEKLERRIEQERRENPESGVRRIRDELKRQEGLGVSAETVRRVVNDAGLGNPPEDTKTSKPRRVYLVPQAIEVLERARKVRGISHRYVFTYKGKPVRSIKTALKTALRETGIKGFTFHDLRRTFSIRTCSGRA
jgi:transposase